MTMVGVRLSDIGERFSWVDVRDFVSNLPPTPDSAVYRARYPQSWWWQPEFDFYSAIVHALQGGNWQRGGGRGDYPKPIRRPKEQSRSDPKSASDLEKRKAVMKRKAVG